MSLRVRPSFSCFLKLMFCSYYGGVIVLLNRPPRAPGGVTPARDLSRAGFRFVSYGVVGYGCSVMPPVIESGPIVMVWSRPQKPVSQPMLDT